MKILFVDDEINILNSFERMLHPMSNKWDMTFEQSPSEAVELIKKINYDVIVTDVFMKDIDGFTLLEKIKIISPRTEVLMITGAGTVKSAVEAMKKGAWDYILKPIDHEEIAAKLERLGDFFNAAEEASENKFAKEDIESSASHAIIEMQFKLDEFKEREESIKQILGDINDAETKINLIKKVFG